MRRNALSMDVVQKFVDEATGGDMHAARVLSLAGSVKGVLQRAALGVTVIGKAMAQAVASRMGRIRAFMGASFVR